MLTTPSIIFSGWCFGTWILFSHILGMSSSQLSNIFQRGSNHQPVLQCKTWPLLAVLHAFNQWPWPSLGPNREPRSQLHGRGVFADANFKRGEVVELGPQVLVRYKVGFSFLNVFDSVQLVTITYHNIPYLQFHDGSWFMAVYGTY